MIFAMFATLLILVLMASIGSFESDSSVLYLTPLIERGDIIKAQQLSRVSTDVIPNSHAAFLTVDKALGNHMFFWFFPAMRSQQEAPLLVWLNGGPGISSMIGLFYENGPMRVKSDKSGNVFLERWNSSWAEQFSMLYIDQPIGTGYSHNEDGKIRRKFKQRVYSRDLYVFLEQFYHLFPEYKSRELYIGGQSYAGKYVPAFAHRVHTEKLANRSSIPLAGIYLGGPFFDAKTQCRSAADFFEVVGALSKKQADDFRSDFARLVKKKKNYESLSVGQLFNRMWPRVNITTYDNYVTLNHFPRYDVARLMTSTTMRHLVHAGNLSYESANYLVQDGFAGDFMKSTSRKLADLMDNYKVLIYNGDMDARTSTSMVDYGLSSVPWSRRAEYNVAGRAVWGHNQNPKGFFTKVGQFCRVVIHNAGHRVPHDQPELSRDMMEQFIKFGCLQN